MSVTTPATNPQKPQLPAAKGQLQRQGIQLLIAIVALMWLVEIINSIDSYHLDTDGGIHPRDFGRIWEIFTSPFLHGSYGHLIANTIPFVPP